MIVGGPALLVEEQRAEIYCEIISSLFDISDLHAISLERHLEAQSLTSSSIFCLDSCFGENPY
jgi:hypothetical protein